jgi:hypothetical protein
VECGIRNTKEREEQQSGRRKIEGVWVAGSVVFCLVFDLLLLSSIILDACEQKVREKG